MFRTCASLDGLVQTVFSMTQLLSSSVVGDPLFLALSAEIPELVIQVEYLRSSLSQFSAFYLSSVASLKLTRDSMWLQDFELEPPASDQLNLLLGNVTSILNQSFSSCPMNSEEEQLVSLFSQVSNSSFAAISQLLQSSTSPNISEAEIYQSHQLLQLWVSSYFDHS